MSRIGAQLIPIPNETTVSNRDGRLTVTGPKGELSLTIHPKANVVIIDSNVSVTRHGDDRLARSIHGLTRMLVANAVKGVSVGFSKKLELQGIGYRAEASGANLNLQVGFTHPVSVNAPEGITFGVEKGTVIVVQGIDKQLVGQVAANIRSIRKPEPYKGKGIRYAGEYVRKKAGKAAKTGK